MNRSSLLQRRIDRRFESEWPAIEKGMKESLSAKLSSLQPLFEMEDRISSVIKQHLGEDCASVWRSSFRKCKARRDFTNTSLYYSTFNTVEQRDIGRVAFAIGRLHLSQTKCEGFDFIRERDLHAQLLAMKEKSLTRPLLASAIRSLTTLITP